VTSEADEEAEENAAGKFLRAEVIFDLCRVPIANDTMIKRPKAHVDTMIHFRLCFGCEALCSGLGLSPILIDVVSIAILLFGPSRSV